MLSRSIITYSAPSAPLAGTSRLHRMAAYTRCPRCAVRPRRPASGSVLSLLVPSRHAVLYDPGELAGDLCAHLRHRRHWPSPLQDKLGAPNLLPPSVSSGSLNFGASPVHVFATACRFASLLDGSDRVSPAAETCTSGLSTRQSPFTLPDMTTVAFGHLHRRVSHPLERQLASLHPEGEGLWVD